MAHVNKGNLAQYDKRFGNTQGNKTVNGGMTQTGNGKLGGPTAIKKLSGK